MFKGIVHPKMKTIWNHSELFKKEKKNRSKRLTLIARGVK